MLISFAGQGVAQAAPVPSLGCSYAYYDLVSLVLKDQGFLQKPGTLLVRQDFADAHPDVVKAVLQAYAQARAWAAANPDGTAAIVAKEAKLPLDVAKLQISRCDSLARRSRRRRRRRS